MVSISSSRLIRERTRNFCMKINDWEVLNNALLFERIREYLQEEYDMIPQKERIGKGIVYISKHVAKEFFLYLKNDRDVKEDYYFKIIEQIFDFGEKEGILIVQHFALLLLSEFVLQFPQKFSQISDMIEKYANHSDWSIRETTAGSILSGIKKNPEETLQYLLKWIKSENENLRRIVTESIRPSAEVKWLRDPTKNDKILDILTYLRKDPSIYVRKSVGNNIKDLTKYMPEKILNLMDKWIELQKIETGIKISKDLAMEIGLNKEEKRLIWTMKHGMRWIKERNPEFHPRLKKLLGENYILYFNEKKNRLAKPPKSN